MKLTDEEIIRMAHDASPDMTWYAAIDDPLQASEEELAFLKRFSALVAQHEREACAKVCDVEALKWKSPKYNFATASANHCAAAIRARGEEAWK